MKIKNRLFAMALAIALLFTGCYGDTSWAASHNGETLPAGVHLINMIGSYYSARNKAAEQLGEDAGDFDVFKQKIDGQSASDWIEAEARNETLRYYAVEAKFGEYGLTLDEEALAQAEESVEYIWNNMEKTLTGNGIARSSYVLYMTNSQKRQKLFDYYYGEGGPAEVSKEELMASFLEKYAVYQSINIKVPGGADAGEADEAALEAQKAEARAIAQSYLDRLANGEAINTLDYDYRLSQKPEDPESVEPEKDIASYERVISKDYAAYYGEALVNGVFDTPVGQAALIEDDTYFYVIKRLDLSGREDLLETYRATLLSGLKTDAYNEQLLAWAGEIGVTVNNGALRRYTAKKLKFEDQG